MASMERRTVAENNASGMLLNPALLTDKPKGENLAFLPRAWLLITAADRFLFCCCSIWYQIRVSNCELKLHHSIDDLTVTVCSSAARLLTCKFKEFAQEAAQISLFDFELEFRITLNEK